jgi:ATP-dependent helicase/nuclease subunit A
MAREAIPRTIAATAVQGLANARVGGGATAVMPGAVTAADEEPLEHRDDASVRRRGRAGTAVGRAVHGVLQVIDLHSEADIAAHARAQAVAEGIAERAREVGDRVRAALRSDPVRRAVASARYWREMYVGVPLGDRVLEGFIDLLYETPDGLAIVDYKTDRFVDEADAIQVAERYRLQGASYALATTMALGPAVASCTFLFLGPSGSVAVPLADLGRATAEVAELLTGAAGQRL